MVELLRSNDLVFIGWVEALLQDAGITPVIMDQFASAVEGSISAIPRRVMVDADVGDRARRILSEAGAWHDGD